jgi:hypothetical protein
MFLYKTLIIIAVMSILLQNVSKIVKETKIIIAEVSIFLQNFSTSVKKRKIWFSQKPETEMDNL